MQIFKALGKSVNLGVSLILVIIAIGLALIALPFWGNKSLIVRSGSMQPTINVGDLIVVSPNSLINSPVPAITAKYKVGDIVAFQESANPETIVTHRVVGAEIKNGQVMYQTKGDANSVADQTMINEKNIIGRSQLTIPHVGKVFAFTKSKIGYPLLIILPALLVILLEINNIFKELTKKKFLMRGSLRDKININSLHVFIPFIAFALIFQNSHSFFIDSAQSTNNTFSAAETFPVKSGDIVINEINWAGNNGGASGTQDEWIELKNTTGSPINVNGWVVEKLGDSPHPNITIVAGSPVPAGGFFLISGKNKSASAINVDPDMVEPGVSLNNDGEQLVLRTSASGTIIDTANTPPNWFFGSNVDPKKSMERKTPPSDGTSATNWQIATTHTNMDGATASDEFGTPKAPNGI